jgi:hypothetical protein
LKKKAGGYPQSNLKKSFLEFKKDWWIPTKQFKNVFFGIKKRLVDTHQAF